MSLFLEDSSLWSQLLGYVPQLSLPRSTPSVCHPVFWSIVFSFAGCSPHGLVACETRVRFAAVTAEFPASNIKSFSDSALNGQGDRWRLVEEESLEGVWAGGKVFLAPKVR